VPRSTDVRSQKSDLIIELNGRVESNSEMDQLSSILKPTIGRLLLTRNMRRVMPAWG